ncbi:pyridoxamine 5'-phosphate oxidase family protein [Propioniciclava coleopterorum]|uniref:pyridoxamine 5'-phosphate oxidase family protein n=1 Tax=Propioniciclava coleopterorum TaxID=2714937 RepID=UPI00197FBE44|nr:pyridoxamine 5'-phosphate oxidase family protein [Propioniciclava coleopterorum]
MATFYDSIEPQLEAFIARQHMFFVATAAPDGRVNVSPKGLDSFRVLGPNRVAWLNGTGSGNETAAHVALLPRMTLMFCAVEGKPWILRLYGTARTCSRPTPSGTTSSACSPRWEARARSSWWTSTSARPPAASASRCTGTRASAT